MFDTHCTLWLPFGDTHFVGEANRANLGHAIESGTDTTLLIANEGDGFCVGHPVDVPFDGLDHFPHALHGGANIARNLDTSHVFQRRLP